MSSGYGLNGGMYRESFLALGSFWRINQSSMADSHPLQAPRDAFPSGKRS
jgi:hypothetical protein